MQDQIVRSLELFQLERDRERHFHANRAATLLAGLELGKLDGTDGLFVTTRADATDDDRIDHPTLLVDDELHDDAPFDTSFLGNLRIPNLTLDRAKPTDQLGHLFYDHEDFRLGLFLNYFLFSRRRRRRRRQIRRRPIQIERRIEVQRNVLQNLIVRHLYRYRRTRWRGWFYLLLRLLDFLHLDDFLLFHLDDHLGLRAEIRPEGEYRQTKRRDHPNFDVKRIALPQVSLFSFSNCHCLYTCCAGFLGHRKLMLSTEKQTPHSPLYCFYTRPCDGFPR